MPIAGQSPREVVHTEMHKFKHGELHSGSSSGPKVTNRKQAIAIALSEARKARASGGGVDNFVERQSSRYLHSEGMIKSTIPGRTDKLPMRVKSGSYVLPADIPSALGQGNTMAGGEILKKMFSSGPYGMAPMHGRGGGGQRGRLNLSPVRIPKSPFAEGGEVEESGQHIPIVAAGGEYIIHPDVVRDIGHGNVKHGHDVLDKFVLKTRAENIKTLKNLDPPKK